MTRLEIIRHWFKKSMADEQSPAMVEGGAIWVSSEAMNDPNSDMKTCVPWTSYAFNAQMEVRKVDGCRRGRL